MDTCKFGVTGFCFVHRVPRRVREKVKDDTSFAGLYFSYLPGYGELLLVLPGVVGHRQTTELPDFVLFVRFSSPGSHTKGSVIY